MGIYKGITVEDGLQQLLPHMHLVDEYRESLQSLQAVWDNLNLLGHLSGTTTGMSNTRLAFSGLTSNLLNNLAERTRARRVQDISAKAQVCIDILVRNLFERTADIGFLATDECIQEVATLAARNSAAGQGSLHDRFRAYVEKYSVYADVILLNPQGQIIDRLVPESGIEGSRDAFIQEALGTSAAYVESYAPSALFADRLPRLLYAYRVCDAQARSIGVLCLCFDLADEMQRIFSGLSRDEDWSVITLLDVHGCVIASSDPYLIPVGAPLKGASRDGSILRFAGRNYLASQRQTQGYQGYMGPGWSALVLVPLESAFLQDENRQTSEDAADELLHAILESDSAFPAALKSIPIQAEAIQRELERSVWNGNVRQSLADKATSNPAFSRVLLAEISNTGMRMKEVFARSIGNLQQTVISARLDDCRFLAHLAIDIMDRNLYERANDCRWWALDPLLCSLLEESTAHGERQDRLSRRLRGINELYTVYDNLVVFDSACRIVATSKPQRNEQLGTHLDAPWAAAALSLVNAAHYAVSDFSPSALYDNRPSYIYAAAFFGRQGRKLGGIGIVFDSEPQFAAMLRDALPADAPEAFGVFLDPAGKVIACSNGRFQAGVNLALPADLLAAASGHQGESRLMVLDGEVMAVGARRSTGYREYKGANDPYRNEVTALIFLPLGEHKTASSPLKARQQTTPPVANGHPPSGNSSTPCLEIATFNVGEHWLGLPVRDIVEATELGSFTRLPNAPPQVFGSMIYQSAAIPLYNLRAALGLGESKTPEEMQVIVINSEDGKRFGLLVDYLAGIAEVPVDHIEPVGNLFVGVTPVLAAIVKTPDATGNMLTLLSVASMYALLRDL